MVRRSLSRWKALPWALLAALPMVTPLAGCATATRRPDVAALYNRAAMDEEDDRNPVIVIPGILGSRLFDPESGRVVWGAYSGDFANPETPDGARLLALPMREGAPLADLRDGVVATDVLDRVSVSVVGLPVELDAYRQILVMLGAAKYRDENLLRAGAVDYGGQHLTCFQFAYDWRRDLVENARALHEYILTEKQAVEDDWAARHGGQRRDIKFDIVAHSMGGLIARYFLMYGSAEPPPPGVDPAPTWAGAPYVDRVILVGTPSAGSVLSLEQFVNGTQYAAILPKYEPALLANIPAIYQLLPRHRHIGVVNAATGEPVDPYDPANWERYRWGPAAPGQDRVLAMLMPEISDPATRRRIAMDHTAKCLARADQVNRALDVPAVPPAGLSLSLIAGDAVPTPAVLAVDPDTGRVRTRETSAGDGTVTRASALLDERVGGRWERRLVSPVPWSQVVFLPHDHLGITQDPVFTDNVLYMLLESRAPGPDPRTAGL